MNTTSDLALLNRRYSHQRQKAIERFRAKPRSEHLLRRLSTYTDRCLIHLVKLAPLPKNSALVAVGGYGRKELYPKSDIDLLILLAQAPTPIDTQHLEQFIAALWDVGLKAATSVRTTQQCIDAAEQDIATQTAQLESRFITGNKTLFDTTKKVLKNHLNAYAFFQEKLTEMRQRHAHYQHSAYALEPNCKESPGALRDLQVLLWLAKAIGLGNSWSEIAHANLLSSAELRAITRASQAFMRLRIELHLLTGRAEDRVLFEYQPDLARIYGFNNPDKKKASEQLMQRYYWAARTVLLMNSMLIQSMEEILFAAKPEQHIAIDDEFEVRNHRLHLRHPKNLSKRPYLILKSFALLQQRPEIISLSADTLRALWHARRFIDEHFRAQRQHQQLFLQLLQAPRRVLYVLQQLAMLNILPRYIPEFRQVVGKMQHDLFHAYTVDQHTLMVIGNLRRFTYAEYAEEHPLATQLMDEFEKPWLLYIAALFHDIAKGRGGNHSELGAADAYSFCLRHQLTKEETELVVFLVHNHLSMSTVAQKKDSSDPSVITAFVEDVDTPRKLSALYLLTIADIKGTNPTIWNSWKAKLLTNTFTLSLRALHGGSTEPSTVLAQRRANALSQLLAQHIPAQDIENLWSVFDISYFLRHETDEIVWHAMALHKALLHPKAIVDIRPVGAGEAIQVMIYTPDQDDLFMRICAYFDQQQFSIQDARIYTTAHGWALDSFVLLLPVEQRFSKKLETHIQKQLPAHLTKQHSPKPFTTAYFGTHPSRMARVFPMTPTIDITAMSEPGKWKISIVCADRPGLLLNIAHLFVSHHISLKSAKIMTLGERVEDVFIVQSHELHQLAFYKSFERALIAAL